MMVRTRITRTALSLSCVLVIAGVGSAPALAATKAPAGSVGTVHVTASETAVAVVKGSSTGKGSATNDQCVQAGHILNSLSNHASNALANNNYAQAAQYANAAAEAQHNAESRGCSFTAA
jgi:hypothetical protein